MRAPKVLKPKKKKTQSPADQSSKLKKAVEKSKEKNAKPAPDGFLKSMAYGQLSDVSASKIGGVQDLWRFITVWLFAVIALIVLVLRMAYLQLTPPKKLYDVDQTLNYGIKVDRVIRAPIIDRNGLALAVSAPQATVIFDPRGYAEEYYRLQAILVGKKERPKKSAREKLAEMDLMRLSAVSGVDIQRLRKAVSIQNIDPTQKDAVATALPKGAGSRYFVLFDSVNPSVVEKLLALKFFGVSTKTAYVRYYPESLPNAPLIGYMGMKGYEVGTKNERYVYEAISGLEKSLNARLSGVDGVDRLLIDGARNPIGHSETIAQRAQPDALMLTIDSRLQYTLYRALEDAGAFEQALWAAGVVVDVDTGEVLAMSSWPSFNANNLAQIKGNRERNRVLQDTVEPGSVMKPFTIVAALESGKYHADSRIDTTPGSLVVGGSVIRDSANYGTINLGQILQKSSNVASAKIALSLPHNAISQLQRRFGFGQKTAIDFYGQGMGALKDPSPKDITRIATLSYGYGQGVTLAQLVQAYAVFGASGEMRPLHLIKGEHPAPTPIISKAHADTLLRMMETVTLEGGTAQKAAIDGYRVAGKTGTARRINPAGGYYPDSHRALFVGLAPVSNPKYAIAIIIEDPKQNKYGGQAAAPVFAKVMKEALRLGNVPMDKPL